MTTYRQVKGYSIKSVASNPDNIKEGQVWYNNSTKQIKVVPFIESWASGGNLNTGRHNLAGTGTQTAGLAFGGTPPVTGKTEEYDGSSWTESGDLNTARDSLHGFGSQTAALTMAGTTGSNTAKTESWDGSSWTEVGDLGTARTNSGAGGSSTDGLINGGYAPGISDISEAWSDPVYTIKTVTVS